MKQEHKLEDKCKIQREIYFFKYHYKIAKSDQTTLFHLKHQFISLMTLVVTTFYAHFLVIIYMTFYQIIFYYFRTNINTNTVFHQDFQNSILKCIQNRLDIFQNLHIENDVVPRRPLKLSSTDIQIMTPHPILKTHKTCCSSNQATLSCSFIHLIIIRQHHGTIPRFN